MSDADEFADLGPADAQAYRAMQSAFAQTARGRWFLAEYARRNPPAAPLSDTGRVPQILASCRAAQAAMRDTAEQIQDVAWTLREMGVASAACDLLDQRTSDIYESCARHHTALRSLETLCCLPPERDASAARRARNGPARRLGTASDDAAAATLDVDAAELVQAETSAHKGDEVTLGVQRLEQLAILAEIDDLDLHTKLRLFT